jgi:hypothetical protein
MDLKQDEKSRGSKEDVKKDPNNKKNPYQK